MLVDSDGGDARHAISLARSFVEAKRGIPSSVIDLAIRACRSKEGRTMFARLDPPNELVIAMRRGAR